MTDQVQLSKIIREWMDTFMHRSMRGWAHQAKTTGMSVPQLSILMQLHYRGMCGISEISDRFEVTNAAASQLVERLVQSGLLERAEDPGDRRAKLIKLSSKGKNLIENGIEQRYRWVDELVSNLSADERAKVGAALEIMTKAARKFESQPANPIGQ